MKGSKMKKQVLIRVEWTARTPNDSVKALGSITDLLSSHPSVTNYAFVGDAEVIEAPTLIPHRKLSRSAFARAYGQQRGSSTSYTVNHFEQDADLGEWLFTPEGDIA